MLTEFWKTLECLWVPSEFQICQVRKLCEWNICAWNQACKFYLFFSLNIMTTFSSNRILLEERIKIIPTQILPLGCEISRLRVLDCGIIKWSDQFTFSLPFFPRKLFGVHFFKLDPPGALLVGKKSNPTITETIVLMVMVLRGSL